MACKETDQRVGFVVACMLLAAILGHARAMAGLPAECPDEYRFNPLEKVCAQVRSTDIGSGSKPAVDDAWPDLDDLRRSRTSTSKQSIPPVPGGYGAGIVYQQEKLRGLYHSELHSRMFVHPDGIHPSSQLDWLFTPATNRMSNPVELVGAYRTSMGDRGSLGLFARSCSENYPCPNGAVNGGWQWFVDFVDIRCNLANIIDRGGHYQTIIQYANRTIRMDDGDPPLWQNEVLLWNFCDNAWDQVYFHEYRETKEDCSMTGCASWGPILETFGEVQPEIDELGAEDTRLYLDGTWHELGPDEAVFKSPVQPWILQHLQKNNGFGAGNRVLDIADEYHSYTIQAADQSGTDEHYFFFATSHDPFTESALATAWIRVETTESSERLFEEHYPVMFELYGKNDRQLRVTSTDAARPLRVECEPLGWNVKRSDGTERLHLDDLAGTSAWIYRQGLSDVSRLNQCIVENEYQNFVGTGDRVEHHRWPLFPDN